MSAAGTGSGEAMDPTESLDQKKRSHIFKICCLCNRVNRGDGHWLRREHIQIPPGIKLSHGLCLDCCEKKYLSLPEMKRIVLEKRK
jgi:hypothetical protein